MTSSFHFVGCISYHHLNAIDEFRANIHKHSFSLHLYEFATTNMVVFVSDRKQLAATPNVNCLVIGNIFDKASHQCIDINQLSDHATPSALFESCYGQFILFDLLNPHTTIYREMTGGVPFYYLYHNGALFFSTDIHYLHMLFPNKLSVNSQSIIDYLSFDGIITAQTHFNEIKELPGGCALTLRQSITVHNVWKPSECLPRCDATFIDSFQSCLQPSINHSDRVVIEFSGGLDSTCILAATKQYIGNHKEIIALNMSSPHYANSNESKKAIDIAKSLDVTLLQHHVDYTIFTLDTDSYKIKPNRINQSLMMNNDVTQIFKHYLPDRTSFLNGFGGDHLFLQSPPSESVIDAYLADGIASAAQVAKKLVTLNRLSYLAIAKAVLSSFFKPSTPYAIDSPAWLLSRPSSGCYHGDLHPLYKNLSLRTAKGQQLHATLQALCNVQSIYHRRPTYYPFLTQPIIEHALSLPCFELFTEQYDRHYLRAQFSGAFPRLKVWDRNKGGTTGFFMHCVKSRFDDLHKLCVNGQLARAGIIHPQRLSNNLSSLAMGDPTDLWPLIKLISTELFLKSWKITL